MARRRPTPLEYETSAHEVLTTEPERARVITGKTSRLPKRRRLTDPAIHYVRVPKCMVGRALKECDDVVLTFIYDERSHGYVPHWSLRQN